MDVGGETVRVFGRLEELAERLEAGWLGPIARLTELFSVLALSPASVELYGVTANGVARRTNEIGIRMVLGVDNGNVLGLELRAAPARLALGLAIGIPAALA